MLKVQEIPSGYDAAKYGTERLMVPARDGQRCRCRSSIRRASRRTAAASSSSTPMAPTAWRSRRASRPAGISLLDRGWAYAIAHIRGGDDLGYQWFLDGKLEKRTNTFNDFVDVAKGLIADGFTSAGQDRHRRAARPAAS